MKFFSYICNCVALDTGMCAFMCCISRVSDQCTKVKQSRWEENT